MKSKTTILIITSCVMTFFLAGCQKNMHHMHEAHAPAAEVVMGHSEHKHNEKKIMIHNPWVRAVPPVSETSAAYMMLMNHGDKDDQLLSVKSSIAKVVEIHNVKKENGMMKMYPVKFFEIPAGKTQELKPGGYHLMLMNLSKTLKAVKEIEFMLHFKHSGMVKVIAPVKEGKPMKHDMKTERRSNE